MQGLAAIVSDSRFAVTTQISEITRLMVGVKVWLFGSAVCDVVISLSEYRAATPWKGTDSLITKLIYNTVETGAVTSIVAVADVVLFITLPSTNLHQWPAFMLGKLYSNVLVTLNARGSRGTPHPSASLSGNIHGTSTTSTRGPSCKAETPRTVQKVHISTTTRVTRDGDDTDRDSKSYARSPL
ncbi:hypothetical protein B0H14DRAFT_2868988 [Mycena olivaceomarginata]|nr:hypothetical protein B0H14DRAFT_2868988 [Mycena olivaceomarginata]